MSRQASRSAATRQRLIDATFDCLSELGYPNTSTVAVCERAGVSRGTMLHHFPTKQQLVLASMEDILVRRVREFRDELGDAELGPIGDILRRMWAAVRGPTFFVWLELALAARSDDELGREFRALMLRFDAIVTSTAADLADDYPGGAALVPHVPIVFSAFNGLALDLLQHEPDAVEEKVERLIRLLEGIAGFAGAKG